MEMLSRCRAWGRNRRQERADEDDSPHPSARSRGRRQPDSCTAEPACLSEGQRPARGALPTPCAGRPRCSNAGPRMSAPRGSLESAEALSDAGEAWLDLDGRLADPLPHGARPVTNRVAGDLDLGERSLGGDVHRSPALAGRRRAHAASAAGAGLAVALALVVHSLAEGPSDPRAAVGARGSGQVARPFERRRRVPARRSRQVTSSGRRQISSRGAFDPQRPIEALRSNVAAAPISPGAASVPAAEFGFEQ
jgi:hypothetical protein